jgi:hypothetical protein
MRKGSESGYIVEVTKGRDEEPTRRSCPPLPHVLHPVVRQTPPRLPVAVLGYGICLLLVDQVQEPLAQSLEEREHH